MVENLDIYHHTVQIQDVSIELEMVRDIDAIIDYYAEQHSDDIDMIPYYAELWPSALALAKYILEPAHCLRGKHIIELGCGLGLPSLVAAGQGARVLATDFHPHNEKFLKRNIDLNTISHISYQVLNWALPPENACYDLVMGSDLLYEERNIDILVSCADCLCAAQGKIIIADPGRRHLQAAVSQFKKRGFDDLLIPVDDIFIIELMRADFCKA